ncbi:MAG: GDYXXLXY domain-containing protein [Dehalococcoidia bacterium]|nr:GDYXXLXY domain-containing protein [Dehalococcoidia bacterium]
MSRRLKFAFWATVMGQVILLLAFIAVKENTLRSGTSILLKTAPIDPRSVLQGDFAILDYEIAELPDYVRPVRQGESFYVELGEGPEGVWQAFVYLREKPDSDAVFIKGAVNSRGRLGFGIDTFFVPEGTGHIIERSRDVKALVVVSSSGSAVLEDLIVDGFPFDPRRPPDALERQKQIPPPPPEGVDLPLGQFRPLSGRDGLVGVDEFQVEVAGLELEFRHDVMFALPNEMILVTFDNSSSVLPHNLVIVRLGSKDAVAADGITAGPTNDWVPPGDTRVIANTRLVGPGETGEMRFMAPQPGLYQFVCTFPGHNSTMFGDFIVLDQSEEVVPQRKP